MRKHMIYADAMRLGGDHVTADISKGLQVPLAVAERIKTFHGGCVATGVDDREMIEIGGETGDWERDRRTVSRAEIIGIMRPRVEEILEEVRAALDAAGFEALLEPADRADRRHRARSRGSRRWRRESSARRCGSAGRCRVHGLPQATTGAALLRARWGFASSRRTRRTSGGTFKFPTTAPRSARCGGRCDGFAKTGRTACGASGRNAPASRGMT